MEPKDTSIQRSIITKVDTPNDDQMGQLHRMVKETMHTKAKPISVIEYAKAFETLPPCQSEDDDNCKWDAGKQGDGEGMSFVTINGTTHHEDGSVLQRYNAAAPGHVQDRVRPDFVKRIYSGFND